ARAAVDAGCPTTRACEARELAAERERRAARSVAAAVRAEDDLAATTAALAARSPLGRRSRSFGPRTQEHAGDRSVAGLAAAVSPEPAATGSRAAAARAGDGADARAACARSALR